MRRLLTVWAPVWNVSVYAMSPTVQECAITGAELREIGSGATAQRLFRWINPWLRVVQYAVLGGISIFSDETGVAGLVHLFTLLSCGWRGREIAIKRRLETSEYRMFHWARSIVKVERAAGVVIQEGRTKILCAEHFCVLVNRKKFTFVLQMFLLGHQDTSSLVLNGL